MLSAGAASPITIDNSSSGKATLTDRSIMLVTKIGRILVCALAEHLSDTWATQSKTTSHTA